MKNKLNRSNVVEIMAILYFILAAIISEHNVLSWICIIAGIENVIESIYFAYKFRGE